MATDEKGDEKAREALARAATNPRSAELVVPSSKATEAEVDVIEMAIDHPPPKPDHLGTPVSVLGAVGLILKTIASPVDQFGWKDVGVIAVSGVLGAALLTRYVIALSAKTPIKDKAKEHIRTMRIAHGWKPKDEPSSNWKRLRELLWRKVFAFLGDKNS